MNEEKNLRKLRTLVKNVKPEHPSWKTGIKWNITTGGFIETLVNFKHIREELIRTKKQEDNFDKSRDSLRKYREKINQLLEIIKRKQHNNIIKKVRKPGISKRNPGKRKIQQMEQQPSKTKGWKMKTKGWKMKTKGK